MDVSIPAIRIALNGAMGRMCRAVADTIKTCDRYEIAFGIDKYSADNFAFPIYTDFHDTPPCDIVVDFSYHTATIPALDFALSHRIPIVIATTGHTEEERRLIRIAGDSIPIFVSSNTSIGIYLTALLAGTAAEFLGDDFDVEIVETHHRIKADAPSGTAILLADAVKAAKSHDTDPDDKNVKIILGRAHARDKCEITIHSVRGGTVVGKHEILFLGDDERLTIIHEAENKNVYVHGVLKAIDFLMQAEHGIYNMHDLLSTHPRV